MTFDEARAWTEAHGCDDYTKRIAATAPPFNEAQRELLAAMKASAQTRINEEAAA